jgi:hypothetical protein
MSGNPHPVYRDNEAVSKTEARAFSVLRLGTASDLRALDGSLFWAAFVADKRAIFYRSSGSTLPDNDSTVIVDASGNRWLQMPIQGAIRAAVANFAGRSAFDGEDTGFTVLVESDVNHSGDPWLYTKASEASADWTGGAPIRGAAGATGATGASGNFTGLTAQISRERGWKQNPVAGEIAIPELAPGSLTITRASAAGRFNSRGVEEAVGNNVLPHHYHPMTGEYLGWLFEPQRINLALYSKEFDNAYWVKARGTISDVNVIAAPDGTVSAEKFEEDTQTGAHGFNTGTTIAVTNGDRVTASIDVKKDERTHVAIVCDGTAFSFSSSFVVNLNDGTVFSTDDLLEYAVEQLPDGWWRISCTVTANATGNGRVGFYCHNGTTTGYAGTSGHGLYFSGAQIAVGRKATKRIPTTSATVTRPNTRAIQAAVGPAKEGTIFCRLTPLGLETATQHFCGVYTDTNNRISISMTNGGSLGMSCTIAGSSPTIASVPAVLGEEIWVAISWRNGEQLFAVNGGVIAASAPVSADYAGTASFVVGSRDGVNSGACHALIREAVLFPRAMSAEELAALTVPFSDGAEEAPVTRTARRAWAGAVTDTSFKAFSDLPISSSNVSLVVSRSRDMWFPVFEHAAGSTTDYAGAAQTYHSIMQSATGLLPDTQYYWAFRVGGVLGHIRSIRTAPANGTVFSFDFLPVSCSEVVNSTEHDVFNAAAAHGVSFVVHLGDFTYPILNDGGAIPNDVGRYRDEVVRQGLSSGMWKLFDDAPVIYMPDSHDSVEGAFWGDTAPQGGTFTQISAVQRQAYRETTPHYPFEQVRLGINAGDLANVTLTQRFQWGRTRFIVPDCQSQWKTGTSIIGDGSYGHWNQKQWLKDQIDEAEGDSSVAMVVLLVTRTWHGVALAWQALMLSEWLEICAYIRDNLTKQCVVICGDGHQGGADDGGYGSGPLAGFPVFMSSGIYQPDGGSIYDVGPFFWNGVDAEIKDPSPSGVKIYQKFRVIDNGGDDIGFETVFYSAPIDADTKEPTVRGTYRHDNASRTVSLAPSPGIIASENVTISVDKTWFGKCSVNYTCSHGPSGTLNFGANKRRVSFSVAPPGGGASFTVTLSSPVGCTITGTNPITVAPASMISAAAGTAIGNLTSQGGLASAFDGATASAISASAHIANTATAGTVGKDWGVGNTKTLKGAILFGPSNGAIARDNANAGASVNAALQGSNDNSNWTTLAEKATGTGNSAQIAFANLAQTAYRYHRVSIPAVDSSSDKTVTELQFFE